MKDNFSDNSDLYARYRPGYPAELLIFVIRLLKERKRAWDCGTGNGQVANMLANFMEEVEATDISRSQLLHAKQKRNISYSQQPAEKTRFTDNYFDLITVAQAIHWFDFGEFYREAKRVLKPSGIIAVIGYGLFKSNPETDKVIKNFYQNIIGHYWDPERKFLEEKYLTIQFPFQEIETPEFHFKEAWNFEHLIGYLNTWSAVKHYQKREGRNPVEIIKNDLERAFGREGEVVFPILLRVGRI